MENIKYWHRYMQKMITKIDDAIISGRAETLTLKNLAEELGYSHFYSSRKFNEISGMTFRKYVYLRKLAIAIKEIRDTNSKIIDIALSYGFSSPEAFSRACKKTYGITPYAYRKHPIPLALQTILRPFDCYLAENNVSLNEESKSEIKVYFVRIPAHKFLHIRNYKSIGYWDFWQKQSKIEGQDCETICGLLESIKGKLDEIPAEAPMAFNGQLMAWINAIDGRICSYGIPLAEAYGVRLPLDYDGPVPSQMRLMNVEEGEYIVFEHGPFDIEKESMSVEKKIETAMKDFDYARAGYTLDTTQERVFYFFHDPNRFWKYVRPVRKITN